MFSIVIVVSNPFHKRLLVIDSKFIDKEQQSVLKVPTVLM